MSNYAWVTLATNDSYSLGALVVVNSLKKVNTIHQTAVLITPGVTESMKSKLHASFNVVVEVNVLDSHDAANLALLSRPELGVTFTKLHCWRLTQFEKCVFLDADTLVLQNCDELFDREELSAAPDVGWPDCFNSGVFVFRPSQDTFGKLIEFAKGQGSFDGGDQGLLNSFFSDWAHEDISKHLPFVYNTCSTACYSYLPAFKQFGQNVKILHFIGQMKPWLLNFDSSSKTVYPPQGYGHLGEYIQQWWNTFCADVHPALSTEMGGLAGTLAQLTLGASRSSEQQAYEESMRRQCWEAGNIDYLGKDSFDNIWKRITKTIETKNDSETPTEQNRSPTPQPEDVLAVETKKEVNVGPTFSESEEDALATAPITEQIITEVTADGRTIEKKIVTYPAEETTEIEEIEEVDGQTVSVKRTVISTDNVAAQPKAKTLDEIKSEPVVLVPGYKTVEIDEKTNSTIVTEKTTTGYQQTITTTLEDGTKKIQTKTFYDPVETIGEETQEETYEEIERFEPGTETTTIKTTSEIKGAVATTEVENKVEEPPAGILLKQDETVVIPQQEETKESKALTDLKNQPIVIVPGHQKVEFDKETNTTTVTEKTTTGYQQTITVVTSDGRTIVQTKVFYDPIPIEQVIEEEISEETTTTTVTEISNVPTSTFEETTTTTLTEISNVPTSTSEETTTTMVTEISNVPTSASEETTTTTVTKISNVPTSTSEETTTTTLTEISNVPTSTSEETTTTTVTEISNVPTSTFEETTTTTVTEISNVPTSASEETTTTTVTEISNVPTSTSEETTTTTLTEISNVPTSTSEETTTTTVTEISNVPTSTFEETTTTTVTEISNVPTSTSEETTTTTVTEISNVPTSTSEETTTTTVTEISNVPTSTSEETTTKTVTEISNVPTSTSEETHTTTISEVSNLPTLAGPTTLTQKKTTAQGKEIEVTAIVSEDGKTKTLRKTVRQPSEEIEIEEYEETKTYEPGEVKVTTTTKTIPLVEALEEAAKDIVEKSKKVGATTSKVDTKKQVYEKSVKEQVKPETNVAAKPISTGTKPISAKPVTTESKQTTTAAKLTTTTAKQATPTEKSATPTEKPATPTEKPASPVTKKATPTEKPATPVTKKATPAAKPATPAGKAVTTAAKQITTEAKQTTTEAQETKIEAKQTTNEAKQTTIEAKLTTIGGKQTLTEAKQTKIEAKQTLTDSKKTTEEKETTTEAKQTTTAAKQATASIKKTITPASTPIKQGAAEPKQIKKETKQDQTDSPVKKVLETSDKDTKKETQTVTSKTTKTVKKDDETKKKTATDKTSTEVTIIGEPKVTTKDGVTTTEVVRRIPGGTEHTWTTVRADGTTKTESKTCFDVVELESDEEYEEYEEIVEEDELPPKAITTKPQSVGAVSAKGPKTPTITAATPPSTPTLKPLVIGSSSSALKAEHEIPDTPPLDKLEQLRKKKLQSAPASKVAPKLDKSATSEAPKAPAASKVAPKVDKPAAAEAPKAPPRKKEVKAPATGK